MKILHLRSSGGLYGAEQVILNLARELNALGCVNHVVCVNNARNPHRELVEEAKRVGISASAIDCTGVFDAATVRHISDIIREKSIEVVHCHDYKACIFGLSAAKGMKVKKIATNHLWTRADLKLRLYETIEGLAYNWFDRVVAVSKIIEKECRPFIFKKEKLTFIANGIDLNRFTLDKKEGARSATRAQLGLKNEDIVIGNMARLSIEKDQANLLRAFKGLTEVFKDRSFRLLIAGDGPERGNLERLAQELGIKERCSFLGVRNDGPQILNALDIYVQSSAREGLPIVILEAMASSLPIVSTKAGGIPQVIRHEDTGLLVEIGDAKAFTDAMARLVQDRALRERIAANARRIVETDYAAGVMAKKYLAVYQ